MEVHCSALIFSMLMLHLFGVPLKAGYEVWQLYLRHNMALTGQNNPCSFPQAFRIRVDHFAWRVYHLR